MSAISMVELDKMVYSLLNDPGMKQDPDMWPLVYFVAMAFREAEESNYQLNIESLDQLEDKILDMANDMLMSRDVESISWIYTQRMLLALCQEGLVTKKERGVTKLSDYMSSVCDQAKKKEREILNS